jgi:formylglycine-generating enzyme required for sulfatase activity
MNYLSKLFWIIALVAIIGFSFLACQMQTSTGEGGTHPAIDGFVWVAPGTFTMGSPTTEADREDGETQHQVTLTKGFYMAKYEVTQKQWQDVTGSLPPTDPGPRDGDNYPEYYVSWYDALKFCNTLSMKEGLTPAYSINGKTDPAEWGGQGDSWDAAHCDWNASGYRLPTEAEWEYACRAGTTTAYNTGDTISDVNSGGTNHPVGQKAPNAWGLYDMHGNLPEWCWDWYGDYPNGPQTDPTGPASGDNRVIRGGYRLIDPSTLRSAARGGAEPIHRGSYQGFRLARTVE